MIQRCKYLLVCILGILLVVSAFSREYIISEGCPTCRGASIKTIIEKNYSYGIVASPIIGGGPFAYNITGTQMENYSFNSWNNLNYREEFGFVFGGELGIFMKFPGDERIELLLSYSQNDYALVSNYSTTSNSYYTIRQDSLFIEIQRITPRLKFSASLPKGLEPYLFAGACFNTNKIQELYTVDGVFTDSAGGDFFVEYPFDSKIELTGFDVGLGLRVRFNDYISFHLEAEGIFQRNEDFILDSIEHTVEIIDDYGNPRAPVEINPFPTSHRLRLIHVNAIFGAEFSLPLIK